MVNVRREADPVRKGALQRYLTDLLPEWFGKESANAKYAEMAEALEGYVAEVDGVSRGLLLLKWAAATRAEIYWMGVEPAFHRHGIGRVLVETVAGAAREHGRKYLFVATLHPDVPYEPYQRTRRFYESMRFAFVLEEQFPADPGNPLAIYLRDLMA